MTRTAMLAGLAVLIALAAAPAAQAYYVDLSITGAGNVWEFTDANEIDEHCTAYSEEDFSSPSTPPTDSLGAACGAGDGAGDYGGGWIVQYRAVAAPGYRFDRWRAGTGETETTVKCDGSGGSAEYTGTNCQFQIWENLHTQARFVDDTAPSMASLNGPSGQINGSAEFTFSAAADPTFARFECRLVTAGESQLHDWQTCSSGHDENPAAAGTEGGYKLYVRAVDRSNNTSAASSWSWTVDKIRPETTLDSGTGPSGTTSATSATFAFSGSADVASYRCRLDGVEAACESPKAYSDLDDGEHTFEVWSRDDAGNDDLSPASRTWTVDATPPDTSLSDGPAEGSSTSSTSASFSFSSGEAGTFECQLDGTGFSPCESPRNLTGLSAGQHTFAVRARDAAGNVDPSPTSRTWTVDTSAPDTSLSDGPAQGSSTSSTSASFSFSSADAVGFECRLDGGTFADCDAPATYSDLEDGDHTFEVRARDGVGNVDPSPASRTWTVDTAAPNTSISGGPAEGSSTTETSASFTFTSSEAGSFECRLDGAAFSACESPRSLSGLAQGRHTFAVRARDAAGNLDGSPATRSWTVTAPAGPSLGSGQQPSTPTTSQPGPGVPAPGGQPGVQTSRIEAKVQTFWRLIGKRTQVAKLTVSNAPVGAKVTVRCKGKGKGKRKDCRFKRRTFTLRGSRLVLAKHFKKRKLGPRTVITIVVAKQGMVAKAFRYTTRARRFPKLTLS